MNGNQLISIGTLSERTGVSVSAIRFYEQKGLIESLRSGGNQRRFLRSDIRRISFILIAQKLGLGLAEIETELARLPQGRTPTKHDWEKVSRSIRSQLDAKIALLERTRAKLDGCIGCGCLSLKNCRLYNPNDEAGESGSGPRFVLG
ncbi:redox-sensitive transcriptional activator SoxR [Croceicoccus ponticola]|uniref:Redox-sensitive transcriptional activator SoxR n=1 Tax=Croceicoccus ponticola TaxID=2217664 RepID=A0A437H1T3_9SPHN|nr:redox-sensitive transcriptional activator SoxR [Croceicoccus ponticola]RVQ69539.1 redox-sensitive transcriptional activator SoxR [Croceicoccus ponticola]